MNEQQPHVEVFSRNRVSHSRITLFIAIPVVALSGFACYALLPFIVMIGYGLLALATSGVLSLVAVLALDVYRRFLHAPYLQVSPNGEIDTALGRMYPLALPAPIVVTEEKADEEPVARVRQALDVLEVHSHGVG